MNLHVTLVLESFSARWPDTFATVFPSFELPLHSRELPRHAPPQTDVRLLTAEEDGISGLWLIKVRAPCLLIIDVDWYINKCSQTKRFLYSSFFPLGRGVYRRGQLRQTKAPWWNLRSYGLRCSRSQRRRIERRFWRIMSSWRRHNQRYSSHLPQERVISHIFPSRKIPSPLLLFRDLFPQI